MVSADKEKAKIYDYQEILFKDNRIKLVDGASFEIDGIFKEEKDSIFFNLRNGEQFKVPFKRISKDTITLFEDWKYRFVSDTSYYDTSFSYWTYDLIGYHTNNRINPDYEYIPIHLYFNNEGKRIVRFNNKTVRNLKELLLFFSSGHTFNKKLDRPLIFIGKGIKLKDLREIYFYLKIEHYNASLVFNRNQQDGYHIFNDKVEIWQEEIDLFIKDNKLPSPPPLPMNFYKEYYLKNKYERTVFYKDDDLKPLEKIVVDGKYLISIDENFSIETYSILQERLRELRKSKNIKYRTEITQLNPIN